MKRTPVRVRCLRCYWSGRRVHHECEGCPASDEGYPCSHSGYGKCPKCGGYLYDRQHEKWMTEKTRG